ncbi:hypothetical protein P7C70_g5492, partial [Phenoliferia sp. Uapishka_3]
MLPGSRRDTKRRFNAKKAQAPPPRHPSPPPIPQFDGYHTPNPLPTTPSESPHHALNHIYTSLDHETFRQGIDKLLAPGHKFSEAEEKRWRPIPDMIEKGSTLGIQDRVKFRHIPPNAPMTAEHETVIDIQFAKDVARGQLAGPYTPEQLESAAGMPIRTAPMRVVPKGIHDPPPPVKKWRIVENLSSPKTPRGDITSVNWELDSAFETCTWTSTANLEDRFLKYDSSHTVMGIDLVEGFMHIPVHPASRPHFCLSWRGAIWVRKVASYGARTTPAIFGNCVDATIAMMEMELPVQAFNQVDDIGVSRSGEQVQDADVRNFLRHLGWNVHPFEADKGFTWSRVFKHNGIIFNLDRNTKTLTPDKQAKYLAFTKALYKTGKASLSDMEKLLGYLIYVCSIVRHRKSFLFRFFAFRRSFYRENAVRNIDRVNRLALKEWITYLETPTITASFEAPQSDFPIKIWTDASNHGIGVVAGDFAGAFVLQPEWRTTFGAHIGPAEAWGVESGLDAALLLGARDCKLIIFCDNLGVVFSWRKGWSRNKLQNESIARMMEVCMRENIVLSLKYVNTHENPADPLSRVIPHWPSHLVPFPSSHPLPRPYGTIDGPSPLRPPVRLQTPAQGAPTLLYPAEPRKPSTSPLPFTSIHTPPIHSFPTTFAKHANDMSESPHDITTFSDDVASPKADSPGSDAQNVSSPSIGSGNDSSSPIEPPDHRLQSEDSAIEVITIEDTPSPPVRHTPFVRRVPFLTNLLLQQETKNSPSSPKYSPDSPGSESDGLVRRLHTLNGSRTLPDNHCHSQGSPAYAASASSDVVIIETATGLSSTPPLPYDPSLDELPGFANGHTKVLTNNSDAGEHKSDGDDDFDMAA